MLKPLTQHIIFFGCIILVSCACSAQDTATNTTASLDPKVLSLIDAINKETERPKWAIDRLQRESDAIFACKMISQRRVDYDPTIAGDFASTSVDCYVTRFSVLSTFKGNAATEIDVVTIKYSPKVGFASRTHDFARFDTRLKLPVLVQTWINDTVDGYLANDPIETTTVEPEYLLFLRQRDDKCFEPISGQRYSGLSVRILND
ncbi:MAG: hypothetical protein U0930_24310 [Pirellulales bacterium]